MAKYLKINNLANLCMVFLLLEKQRHGYELFLEVEKKTGTKIGSAQVYPFLKKLLKNDLLETGCAQARGKKSYCFTAKGRKFAKEQLSRFGAMFEAEAEKKVKPCAHCACKIYGNAGHLEKIKGKKMFFCCAHCAASYKKTLR